MLLLDARPHPADLCMRCFYALQKVSEEYPDERLSRTAATRFLTDEGWDEAQVQHFLDELNFHEETTDDTDDVG